MEIEKWKSRSIKKNNHCWDRH